MLPSFPECGELGGDQGHAARKHKVNRTKEEELLLWGRIPTQSPQELFSGENITEKGINKHFDLII